MEAQRVVIKTQYNGDIRRITVEDSITFKELRKLLRKLYKVPHFKITYTDEESESISLNSDVDLSHAIKQAVACSRVVRLTLEATEAPLKPALMDSAASVPVNTVTETTVNIDQLFNNRDFTERLEKLVIQTLTSKPVLDLITDRVTEALNSRQQSMPQVDTTLIPRVIEETSAAVGNIVTNALSEIEQFLQPIQVPLPVVIEERVEQIREERPVEVEPEAIPQEEKIIEEETSEEKEESDELPEFVVLNNNNEPQDDRQIRREGSQSAFQSLISLVRGVVHKPKEVKEEEDDVQIPDLEDLLQQLNDMGFNDREANIKTLKFHKRYNEGMDEVIEDLLLQRFEQQRKDAHIILSQSQP